jgi:NDP-sugar pyrophosphorylase family protein
MTDLITKIRKQKKKIKIFNSYEEWHDVGTHEKLNEMRKKFNNK